MLAPTLEPATTPRDSSASTLPLTAAQGLATTPSDSSATTLPLIAAYGLEAALPEPGRPAQPKPALERDQTPAVARELAQPPLSSAVRPRGPEARMLDAPATRMSASASASITLARVRGPLSAATIKHGVERVGGSLASCHARAQSASEPSAGEMRVQLRIDASGHAHPGLEGVQSPSLGACLRAALSKVVCPAPDTGDAQASLVPSFDP